MNTKLDLATLRTAVAGAALRCRRRLQHAGGEGDKVFPPGAAAAAKKGVSPTSKLDLTPC
jgi:hypothetical protein